MAAPADLRRHRNRDDPRGEFTLIGRVLRPGIAEIDAESGAVSGRAPHRPLSCDLVPAHARGRGFCVPALVGLC